MHSQPRCRCALACKWIHDNTLCTCQPDALVWVEERCRCALACKWIHDNTLCTCQLDALVWVEERCNLQRSTFGFYVNLGNKICVFVWKRTCATARRSSANTTRLWPCVSTRAPGRMKGAPRSAIFARARTDVSAKYSPRCATSSPW